MASSVVKNPKKILCIGIVCVDVVVTVDDFPSEDHLTKGREPHWQRGGNAANDCTVLALLNCPCELLTTIARHNDKRIENNFYTQYILNDLKQCGISYEHAVYHDDVYCPVSHVILNAKTGSRTIVYLNPDLPEVTLSDFQKLNLEDYQWIHFEGRTDDHVHLMKAIREWNENRSAIDRIPISLEMELPHCNYEVLSPWVDYVFVSKDLALERNLMTKEDAINNFWVPLREGATLVFPWGAEGAAFRRGKDGIIETAKAYPPATGVIDTLAAGDSFISSTIFALSRGHPIDKAVDFGCRVAGHKVGVSGIVGLKDIPLNIYEQCFVKNAQ